MFALLLSGNYALANEACLLETNADFMGVKLDIKDCIQNAGMATSDFKVSVTTTTPCGMVVVSFSTAAV
jgi:hypothetical protein